MFPGQPPIPVTSHDSILDQQNITASLGVKPKLGASSSTPWCQPLQGYAIKLPTFRSFWSTCQASLAGHIATCNSYGRWSGSPFSKIRENVLGANDLACHFWHKHTAGCRSMLHLDENTISETSGGNVFLKVGSVQKWHMLYENKFLWSNLFSRPTSQSL